jgi:Tol biopolymer transport system component
LIASSQTDQNAEFSPDASRIVFESDRSGSLEIWVARSDGSEPVKLTSFGDAVVQQPHWSPDGRKIVFHATVAGNRDIYVISSAGGKPARLTDHSAFDRNPRWSRDGRWIYFNSTRDGRPAIWKVAAGGGAAVPIAVDVGGAGTAQESPDAQTLYFIKQCSVWTMPVAGGTAGQLIPLDCMGLDLLGWTVREDGILALVRRTAGGELQHYDFATKVLRTIFKCPVTAAWGLSVSPDGKSALIAMADPAGTDLMLIENFR